MNNICIISQGYPTDNDPFFSFVGEIAVAMTKLGVKCYVIAPQSVTKGFYHRKKLRPYHWTADVDGNSIEVYQPRYITLSSIKDLYIGDMVYRSYSNAVLRTVKKHLLGKIDAFYGHFWYSGICAAILGTKYGKPAFVASGESSIEIFNQFHVSHYFELIKSISGVICVSTKNKYESIEAKLTRENRCVVIPNAVDTNTFDKINRHKVREELGFSDNDFIISFVGAFNNRKGSIRVSKAVDELKDVKSIFIGKGKMVPSCNGILFSGTLPHELIPKYLNASDVFVLPTLAEGCCNAIVEALACGIPVISSNRIFNDDILSDDYSIRIDPESVDQIKNAIKHLKENPDLRNKMAEMAYSYGHSMNIENRAKMILNFMDKRIEEGSNNE